MNDQTQVNPAHNPGATVLAFSGDGSFVTVYIRWIARAHHHYLVPRRIYTGGADSLVRIWDVERGEDQEPPSLTEANDDITTVAVAVCRLVS